MNDDAIDLTRNSVLELYVSGRRYMADYEPTDAVEHYLELHPGADRMCIEAELRAALARTPA